MLYFIFILLFNYLFTSKRLVVKISPSAQGCSMRHLPGLRVLSSECNIFKVLNFSTAKSLLNFTNYVKSFKYLAFALAFTSRTLVPPNLLTVPHSITPPRRIPCHISWKAEPLIFKFFKIYLNGIYFVYFCSQHWSMPGSPIIVIFYFCKIYLIIYLLPKD